ncbi:ATP-binding protein, partial [Streptomyces sp. NPDC026672]
WLTRQPEAFYVYRSLATGEAVAFMAWLRLGACEDEEVGTDAVVAAAWNHSRSAGPIRSGEHIALARFMVYPPVYQRPSPVTDLVQIRILSEWMRARHLAWSYIVVADPAFWEPQMEYLDQHRVAVDATVGSRTYGLYAHDWRAVPLEPWLDRHVEQELFGARRQPAALPADLVVLSREEFDDAVHDALRSWRNLDRIAVNPLTRSRLTAGLDGEPAAALRDVLADVVEELGQDPRSRKLHTALVTAFFRGVPTQEAMAARLGLPLSTFRRHRARGLQEVCDRLWHGELYGAPLKDGGRRAAAEQKSSGV